MKKYLAFAGVLALASVAFLPTAAAFQQPVQKTGGSPKKVVDFTAKLNGPSDALGKTGVTPKIQSAAIAKDGTITVRATIVDSNNLALDRLGVATIGPVSMSFIAAYIPAGQTQYVAYTTSVSNPTLNLTMPPQTQAANDSGGTFTTNAIGDYTYTFKTKAPVTFEYILLDKVNDFEIDANRLAYLIKGFPHKVNLIPYNPTAGLPYERPPLQSILRFQSWLKVRGVPVFIRKPKGLDIGSACGQLGPAASKL